MISTCRGEERLARRRLARTVQALGTLVIALFSLSCQRATNPAPSSGAAAREYRYGTKLEFGQQGTADNYEVAGWNKAEADATWTQGPSALLEFAVSPPAHDITLTATVSGFTKLPEIPNQPVDVVVNGKPVAHWEVAAKGEVRTTIPRTLILADGVLRIEFKMPDARSPQSLGLSVDGRQLGLQVFDLVLKDDAASTNNAP